MAVKQTSLWRSIAKVMKWATAAFIGATASLPPGITVDLGGHRKPGCATDGLTTQRPRYRLTFEQGPSLPNPTRSDIKNAVEQMEAGREDFVILHRSDSDLNFIQAARLTAGKYDFEYSTYVADSIYRFNIFECTGMTTASTVQAAMSNYAQRGRSWMKACAWRRVEL